jgi:hypothetical protein
MLRRTDGFNEGENVTVGGTAVAVIVLVGIDPEGPRFLLVERTRPNPILAFPVQLNAALAYQLDQIRGGLHLPL